MKTIIRFLKKKHDEKQDRKDKQAVFFALKQQEDERTIKEYKGIEALLPPDLRSRFNLEGRKMEHRIDHSCIKANLDTVKKGKKLRGAITDFIKQTLTPN